MKVSLIISRLNNLLQNPLPKNDIFLNVNNKKNIFIIIGTLSIFIIILFIYHIFFAPTRIVLQNGMVIPENISPKAAKTAQDKRNKLYLQQRGAVIIKSEFGEIMNPDNKPMIGDPSKKISGKVIDISYINKDGIKSINQNGYVILNDNTVRPDNSALPNGDYIIDHKIIKKQPYNNTDFYSNILLSDISKSVVSILRSFGDKNKIEYIQLNNGKLLTQKELADLGYEVVGNTIIKKKIIPVEFGVDNAYRIDKILSTNIYKNIYELNKSKKVISKNNDSLKNSSDDIYYYFNTLEPIENILIIDPINKKSYMSVLSVDKNYGLKLRKEYLYEALYHDNIPKNKKILMYTYKSIYDNVKITYMPAANIGNTNDIKHIQSLELSKEYNLN